MSTEVGHKNIAQAFFAAQRNMHDAVKGKDNPFFKSKYADLNSVREAVVPALMEQGICVTQPEVVIDGKNYVRTLLIHVDSGTTMQSDVEILLVQANNPQAQGSSITYARRYGLQSLCAIGAADDDGNAGANVGANAKTDTLTLEEEIALSDIKRAGSLEVLMDVYNRSLGVFSNQNVLLVACSERKKQLKEK